MSATQINVDVTGDKSLIFGSTVVKGKKMEPLQAELVDALFREYNSWVKRVLRKQGIPEEEIDDIAQEAWVFVCKANNYPSSPKTVLRIAIQWAIDRYVRSKPDVELVSLDQMIAEELSNDSD